MAATRRGKTLGELIEDSLAFYGIKTEAPAADLVARARGRSSLEIDAAERLALAETRAARRALRGLAKAGDRLHRQIQH